MAVEVGADMGVGVGAGVGMGVGAGMGVGVGTGTTRVGVVTVGVGGVGVKAWLLQAARAARPAATATSNMSASWGRAFMPNMPCIPLTLQYS